MRFGPRLDVKSLLPWALVVLLYGGLAIAAFLFVLIYPPALILVFIALIFAAAIAATLIVGWIISAFWPPPPD